MKRTRVRRAGVVAWVLGGVLLAGVLGSRAGGGAAEGSASKIYVVRPGDTVWSIIERQAGAGDDPRPLVDRLIRLNDLRDAVIRPGQRLILPS